MLHPFVSGFHFRGVATEECKTGIIEIIWDLEVTLRADTGLVSGKSLDCLVIRWEYVFEAYCFKKTEKLI